MLHPRLLACLLPIAAACGHSTPEPRPAEHPPAGPDEADPPFEPKQASEERNEVRKGEEGFDVRLFEAELERKRTWVPVPLPTHPSREALAEAKGQPSFLSHDGVGASVRSGDFRGSQALRAFGGAAYRVEAKAQRLDGFLVLPIDATLANLRLETLRVARYDEVRGRYGWVDGSEVSHEHGQVWARIGSPGDYAVFGVLADAEMALAVRTFCDARSFYAMRPMEERLAFGGICNEILCNDVGQICDLCFGGNDRWVDLEPCDIYTPPIGEVVGTLHEDCGGACGWESVGPNNRAGHIDQIIVDPTDTDRVYAAAFNGGLWVIDSVSDYPETEWRPLTDEHSTRMSAVAVAPSDGERLYGGGRTGNFYRSTDRGAHWQRLAVGALGSSEIDLITVHPDDEDTLWLVNASGLFESVDGGVSWTNVFAGNMTDFDLDPGDPDIRYLSRRNHGVYKSVDGGGTWELVLGGEDTGTSMSGVIQVALGVRAADGSLQTDANRRVVGRVIDEVWVNDSGGEGSWTSLGKRGNNPGYGATQYDWNYAVGISPFDPDVIYSGGIAMWRKSSGSDDWVRIAGLGKLHEDQHWIELDPVDPDVAYLANDGGAWRSADSGQTWTNFNRGLVTTEFYRIGVQNNRAFGNLYHNGIKGTEDLNSGSWSGGEGNSWEFRSVFADPVRPRRFYVFDDKDDLFRVRVFPQHSGEKKFINYGHFEAVPARVSWVVGALDFDLRSAHPNLLVSANAAGGEPHRLMRTWEANLPPSYDDVPDMQLPEWEVAFTTGSSSGDRITAVKIARYHPIAYAITSDGRTFVNADLDDVDSDWNQVGDWSSGVIHMAVNPVDPNLIYALRGSGLGRSYDGGQTWADIGGSTLPSSGLRSIEHHPNNEFTLFMSAGGRVYMSVDRGDTWVPVDLTLPNASVRQVFVESGYLYAVTHGRGLWRIQLCRLRSGEA